MINLPRGQTKKSKITIEIPDFKGGSNKYTNEARLALNEALVSKNLMQTGDGQWTTRWGTSYYGEDLSYQIDGAKEFVKSDGTTELIAVANGVAYKSTNGGAWSSISGATFTAGVQCYFMQIAGYMYIANGTDALTRYNGTVLTTYTSLNAPTGLQGLASSSLSGSGFTYYTEVTALNDVGETVGSTEASCTVSKARDGWISNDSITWSWNAVSTANRYQLYLSDEQGDETLLISTTALSYVDDGSLTINPYVITPLQNTTSAPKFKSMCVSGNRIWATNNDEDMYKVYFSGTGQFIGTFSDFYGGGWIDLEKGGREVPQVVVHYQSGQGEGRLTTLCKTPEGKGAVWQIQVTNLSVGSSSFSVPAATKVVGSFGTQSILGVVQTDNDIMFPNKRGWFNLGPKAQYYGVLRTQEISAKIRTYWKSLIGSKIGGICAYFFDAKVFISVPTTSAGNTRTIILDTERSNWTVEWTIGAKEFIEYTDSSGVSHLLYIPTTGTQLIEINDSFQGDLGVAFSTDYTSGRYQLDKLWKEFARVDKVFFKLGSPRGVISVEVSGSEKKGGFRGLKSATITPEYSLSGLGYDVMGTVELGATAGVTSLFSDSADLRYVAVRKKLRDIQFRITTSNIDANYTLLGIIMEGRPLKVAPPRTWKAN
jgi:hypothetical protein